MLNNAKPGFHSATEFAVSALPWVTSSTAPAAGSPVRLDFDKITKCITITNRDTTVTNTLSVGFTRNGIIGSNKFVLNGGQSVTLDVRVKSLWLQGETGTPDYSVFAGLTMIDAINMPTLTGSIWGNVG